MQSPAQKNLAKLPARCYARHPSTNDPILITAGERGYHWAPPTLDVDAANTRHGITPAQVEAMLVGSMFGWEVPGANPDMYPELNRKAAETDAAVAHAERHAGA